MLIQFEVEVPEGFEYKDEYNHWVSALKGLTELYFKKNHDYGSSWKLYHVQGIVTEMMTRCARMRRLEELKSEGKTPACHEGITEEFRDLGIWSVLGNLLAAGHGMNSEEICDKYGLDKNTVLGD